MILLKPSLSTLLGLDTSKIKSMVCVAKNKRNGGDGQTLGSLPLGSSTQTYEKSRDPTEVG